MRESYQEIFSFYIVWRVLLFGAAFLAVFLIPTFGARFPYYESELVVTGFPPWIWGFGNFDGVHYLNIAKVGYEAANTQAFFPLYPLLIRYLNFFGSNFITALVLSNFLFILGLLYLYKLFRIDFTKRDSLNGVLLLVVFPTAYYFGAIYTESLFLLLSVMAIYLTRKRQYFWASLFIAFASATRVIGIFLVLLMFIELYKDKRFDKRSLIVKCVSLIIAPLGLLGYMYFLFLNYNDPLYFLSVQPAFGAERSNNHLVLFPQVVYRYLKILISLSPFNIGFFNAFLEFVLTIIPLSFLMIAYKKIRLSYLVFICGCLLLPTLTGTFSSMPRYALMSFLVFPLVSYYLGKRFKYLVIFFALSQALLVGIFVRGYWVS